MGSRLELHNKLLEHADYVYFQPPSGMKMSYPCIVYSRNAKHREYGNDKSYIRMQGYQVTAIDRNPDSFLADDIEDAFPYCAISQYFVNDNLHHTTLQLYY